VKTQVAQRANAEHLVESLHSTDPEEKEVSKKSLGDYVVRLLFLQKMITGRNSATLDLNLFRDTPRVLKAIEAGISASGATKGQPWALATKLVYWGALSGVLRRLESYEDARNLLGCPQAAALRLRGGPEDKLVYAIREESVRPLAPAPRPLLQGGPRRS